MNDEPSRRRGEDGSAPFRSGRIFSVGNNWYFTTREGEDHGRFRAAKTPRPSCWCFCATTRPKTSD